MHGLHGLHWALRVPLWVSALHWCKWRVLLWALCAGALYWCKWRVLLWASWAGALHWRKWRVLLWALCSGALHWRKWRVLVSAYCAGPPHWRKWCVVVWHVLSCMLPCRTGAFGTLGRCRGMVCCILTLCNDPCRGMGMGTMVCMGCTLLAMHPGSSTG